MFSQQKHIKPYVSLIRTETTSFGQTKVWWLRVDCGPVVVSLIRSN